MTAPLRSRLGFGHRSWTFCRARLGAVSMARTFLRFRKSSHHIPRTRRWLAASALLLGLALAANPHAYAQFPKEKPTGYVSDLAGVLSPAARQGLESLCTGLDQRTKAQLAIVTVKSLQGRPLEEFTIDLATKWGIGPKGSDRGVMLFLAIQDRRSRIEVGYGLEPIIPDGRAGEILRSMTPYLRHGDYDGAISLGAASIAQIIAQDTGVSLPGAAIPRRGVPPRSGDSIPQVSRFGAFLISLFVIALFAFVYLLAPPEKRNRWKYWFPEGGGSGGWTGGGGGGGGFGGFGGGGFGGGGASGRW